MKIANDSWVRRDNGGKWHLVESTVDDEVVTHCGRFMRMVTNWYSAVRGPMYIQLEVCYPGFEYDYGVNIDTKCKQCQ